MDAYIVILKNIIKNDKNEEFDDIIKNVLVKIFDIYYLDRDIQSYNIDNVFKKYNIDMYNSLKRKYKLTNSKKLIFKKRIYDKREYIMFLLKKNNFVLNENESYNKIANEILKKENIKLTSYIHNFVKNRTENKI